MPAPRYVDAVRNGGSTGKKDVSSFGTSSTRPVIAERSTSHQKAVVRLPHDPRFVFPFAAATGRRVIVQVKSGVQFEGTLHGPVLGTKNVHITLKDARKLSKEKTASMKEDFYQTLIIPSQEFVQMKAPGIPFHPTKQQNGLNENTKRNDYVPNDPASASSEGKADIEEEVIPLRDENDMTGFEGDAQETPKVDDMASFCRPLVPWDGGDPTTEVELGSEKATDWCQFEANKATTNSTFSMDPYTSKLDLSKSKYTEEEAAKIAMEIESYPKSCRNGDGGGGNRSGHFLDDSGIMEEDMAAGTPADGATMSTMENKSNPNVQKPRPFSWAEAAKGKLQHQQNSNLQTKPIVHEMKQESRSMHEKSTSANSTVITGVNDGGQGTEDFEMHKSAQQPVLAHQMDTPPVFENKAEPSRNTGGVYEVVGNYPLASTQEKNQQQQQQQKDQISALDPVWNEDSSKREVVPLEFEAVSNREEMAAPVHVQSSSPSAPPSVSTTQLIQRPEVKKTTKTVVPGISFKDILKANLKSPAPASAPTSAAMTSASTTGPKQRAPVASNHSQEQQQKTGKMSDSTTVVDPSRDPVVQSPRAGGYAGKLITCPATSNLRHPDRNFPSEDHLMSPGMIHDCSQRAGPPPPLPAPMGPPPPPGHPMFFAPKPLPPGAMSMMPHPPPNMTMNLPPHGFRDLGKDGQGPRIMPPPPLPPPQYGGVPGFVAGPLDGAPSPMAHPPPHNAAVMSPNVGDGVEETAPIGGSSAGGHSNNGPPGRRSFQLNPKAKSYKPVTLAPPGSPHQDYYQQNGARFTTSATSASMDSNSKVHPPTVDATSPAAGGGGGSSSSPVVGRDGNPTRTTSNGGGGGPANYGNNQGPPGCQPPFIPPNVVTPWPSFPGTGVWHSGLGTPRPGTPGFIPPGMPSPYPMFMPGMPPFMGGMQEQMWRPPPHGHPSMHGMPDQQSIAMMWSNFYSQLVPPNERMWNSAKGPPGGGNSGNGGGGRGNPSMSRQGRNRRPPPPPVAGQSNTEMQ